MRLTLFFLFIPLAAGQGLLGDRVQVGVIGGVAFRDPLRAFGRSASKPYILGPSVDLRVRGGFVIEADVLFRRLGSSSAYNLLSGRNLTDPPQVTPVYDYSSRLRSNYWELPVLAKYNFQRGFRGLTPFLATGYAFRTSWDKTQSQTNNPGLPARYEGSARSPLGVGAVVAAGASWKVGPVKISPQFRYTRWGDSPGGARQRNQVDFLVGFHF